MNYSLIFNSQVETDVGDAYIWYEARQEGLGERFLKELAGCYTQLEINPGYYGSVVKSFRRVTLKRFPYIIAFEIISNKVFVYAVFHSSRNQKAILKRKRSI